MVVFGDLDGGETAWTTLDWGLWEDQEGVRCGVEQYAMDPGSSSV